MRIRTKIVKVILWCSYHILGVCLSEALKGLGTVVRAVTDCDTESKTRNATETLMDRDLISTEIVKLKNSENADTGGLVEHIWFDYHYKCAKGKTSSLGELISMVEPITIGPGSYLHVDRGGKIVQRQCKILRTNCVDCLDRTNVVQSTFARRALSHQLEYCTKEKSYVQPRSSQSELKNILSPFSHKALESIFREMWGDNGDSLSLLYAGTMALKRDVTRMGKRTRQVAFVR